MHSLNKVTLIGNVGDVAEIRTTQNGDNANIVYNIDQAILEQILNSDNPVLEQPFNKIFAMFFKNEEMTRSLIAKFKDYFYEEE